MFRAPKPVPEQRAPAPPPLFGQNICLGLTLPGSAEPRRTAGVKDGYDGVSNGLSALVGGPLGRVKAGLYALDAKFFGNGIREFFAVADTYFSKDFEKSYKGTFREKQPGVVLIFVLAFVAWATIGYGIGQMTQPDHRPPPPVKLTTAKAQAAAAAAAPEATTATAAAVFSDDEGAKEEEEPKVVPRKTARGRSERRAAPLLPLPASATPPSPSMFVGLVSLSLLLLLPRLALACKGARRVLRQRRALRPLLARLRGSRWTAPF